MSFKASTLCGGNCTASDVLCGAEDFYRAGLLLKLSRSVLNFVKPVGLSEVISCFTFDIPQVYLAIHHIVEVDWECDGNVGWLPCKADDAVVLEIPAGDVPGRK